MSSVITSVHAVTVDELNDMLSAGGKPVTIIDIRVNSSYQKGHILNAINIPASIIGRKQLPPLGDIYVYGDGIDEEQLENAVAALNDKPGINAQAVEGGYAAWVARHSAVTREHEMGVRQVRNLTYSKLKRMTSRSNKPVLVDLRAGDNLEQLQEHFPGTRVIDVRSVSRRAPDKVIDRRLLASIPRGNSERLILIDDGDGTSEKVSDKLHAAGVRRLAILAGGEETLRTRGVAKDKILSTGEQSDQ
jgi:rhodanese-related sulfurtransferase